MSSLSELLLTIAIVGMCLPPLLSNWITLQHQARTLVTTCRDNSEKRYLFTTLQQQLISATQTQLVTPTKISGIDSQNMPLTISYTQGKLQLKKGAANNVNLNNQLPIKTMSFTKPDPTHIQIRITTTDTQTWIFQTTP